jgi:hypothetical protein
VGRKLDCLSSCCGFDSRCHRFHFAAFDYWLGRLLLRRTRGDRNTYALLHSRLSLRESMLARELSRSERRLSEVTRPDEDTVLKTAAANHRCGFESHGFRFFDSTLWERLHTGGVSKCEVRRVKGETIHREPISNFTPLTSFMGRSSNGKMSVLHAENRGSIPRCSTFWKR